MPWALRGADHGFFQLEWADHPPYLRAPSAPKGSVEWQTDSM